MVPSKPRLRWSLPLLAAATLVACEDTASPEGEIGVAAAETVALFLSDDDGTGDFLMIADEITGPHQVDRTRDCPDGGTRGLTGTRDRSVDEEARIASTSWSTVQTNEGCTFTRMRRGEDVTVVMDGSVTAEGSATHQLPEEHGERRQVLSYVNRRVGSTTTTFGDRTRTCDIDVTERYDAQTDDFTIQGMICGRSVDVTREHRLRPQGGGPG